MRHAESAEREFPGSHRTGRGGNRNQQVGSVGAGGDEGQTRDEEFARIVFPACEIYCFRSLSEHQLVINWKMLLDSHQPEGITRGEHANFTPVEPRR